MILCHGLGADGNDLIGLAPTSHGLAKRKIPIAERAFPCDMSPLVPMVQPAGTNREAMLAGAKMAHPILDAFIDQQLETHNLTEDKLALIGSLKGP